MSTAHCENRGTEYAEPGKRDVILVHATWVGEHSYFWECCTCPDSFGPLVHRDDARVGAREHITAQHGDSADT